MCAEKIWFVGGDEYEEDKFCVLLIFRDLYGMNYAGFSWISALVMALQEIGLNPMMVYSNVYIRETMRPDDYE